LIDPLRSKYYVDYLEAILTALSDGVNVVGVLAWSIYDNLEWSSGYGVKFGIQVSKIIQLSKCWEMSADNGQYVNLTTQERYFKASAFEYVNMFNIYQEK
jgi:beta-glucosidase